MFYFTGDTHSDLSRFTLENFPEQKHLTKNDYVVILGDFGIVWTNEKDTLDKLEWLEAKPFTTLFVEGNHENFEKLNKYPRKSWKGGQIGVLSNSVFHLKRGQVFTINNKKFFTFGGANSVDKIYRTPSVTWWAEELPNKEEENVGLGNLEKHNWKVDYVLTHECPLKIFNRLKKYLILMDLEIDSMKKYLDYIDDKLIFKYWYFGHYHYSLALSEKYFLLYKLIQKG